VAIVLKENKRSKAGTQGFHSFIVLFEKKRKNKTNAV
jgi:hypothetical protein